MATTLSVGNLVWRTTTAAIEAPFGQVGAVDSATLIAGKFSGQARGFGFVDMRNDHEAETAIEWFNEYDFGGRALTVNKARPQRERSGGGRSSFGGGGRSGRTRHW